jgi:uncharacterized protein YdiU (UPF0061 family)
VFSSIDQHGRYAFANQPQIAVWNVAQLASSLLPLIDPDEARAVALATEAVHGFGPVYEAAWEAIFLRKIGIAVPRDGDADLAQALLEAMAANGADFTRTFRALSYLGDDPGADEAARAEFIDPTAFDAWAVAWRARLADEPRREAARQADMARANPAFIPRNHRIEEAIQAAVADDLAPFERLVTVLAKPFDDQPAHADLQTAPEEHEAVRQTFCGT